MKASEIVQNTQMNAYIQQVTSPQRSAAPQQGEDQLQAQAGPVQTASRRDRVDISPQSRMASEAVNATQVQERERAQKIQALKEQLQNGTYEVNPINVADAMMRDLIKNLG